MPHDKIKRNDASYNAGFLVSKIYTDQEQAILDAGFINKMPIYDRVLGNKSMRQLDVEIRSDAFKLRLLERSFGTCASMKASKFSLKPKIINPLNFLSHGNY